jgi:hypothetical protein
MMSGAIVLSAALWWMPAVAADEPTKQAAENEPKQEEKTKVEKDIDRSFDRYKVFVEGDPKPLTVLSVLTWNNPLAGGTGKYRTVLFLQDGQPKSVCCTWGSSSNRLYHEFGSLTRSGLRGELDGKGSWEMAASSLKFRPVPDSDEPVADRRRRLLQMKKLIRRFGAIETKSRQGKPTREQLRLLPTPLYRYEKESDLIVDGAVFCFVHTTDPEALVVLEAVRSGETTRWEYAFVRRTTLPVIGQLDEETVWSTDEVGYKSFNQLPYAQ